MKPKSQADTNGKHRIFLVEDHPVLREGLALRINQEKDIKVVGSAEGAADAIKVIPTLKPDLVIVDISIKGSHGLELIKDLTIRYPDLPTLVFSMHDESIYAERVLRAGARGYLMKQESSDKLLDAIRRVVNGGVYVSEKMSSKLLSRFAGKDPAAKSITDLLTDREIEIFHLIGQGLTTNKIASQLHISPKTVEAHRMNIKKKCGMENGHELMRCAIRWVSEGGLEESSASMAKK